MTSEGLKTIHYITQAVYRYKYIYIYISAGVAGSLCGRADVTFFLANLLTFFLAYFLTVLVAYHLTFFLFFSGISSGLRSGIPYGKSSDILSGVLSGISWPRTHLRTEKNLTCALYLT